MNTHRIMMIHAAVGLFLTLLILPGASPAEATEIHGISGLNLPVDQTNASQVASAVSSYYASQGTQNVTLPTSGSILYNRGQTISGDEFMVLDVGGHLLGIGSTKIVGFSGDRSDVYANGTYFEFQPDYSHAFHREPLNQGRLPDYSNPPRPSGGALFDQNPTAMGSSPTAPPSAPVPEPATLALLTLGGLALLVRPRRRGRAKPRKPERRT